MNIAKVEHHSGGFSSCVLGSPKSPSTPQLPHPPHIPRVPEALLGPSAGGFQKFYHRDAALDSVRPLVSVHRKTTMFFLAFIFCLPLLSGDAG